MTIWDDPRADLILTAEWNRGATTREIAATLTAAGLPATKNAVISRANRRREELGIKARLRPLPAYLTTSFLKLRELPEGPTGCRYITGDPDGIFTKWCDAPMKPGSSYCSDHHSICWTPSTPPSKKPFAFTPSKPQGSAA